MRKKAPQHESSSKQDAAALPAQIRSILVGRDVWLQRRGGAAAQRRPAGCRAGTQRYRKLYNNLKQGQAAPSCESWRRAKDGRDIKVWLTTSVLLGDGGKPHAIVITERIST